MTLKRLRSLMKTTTLAPPLRDGFVFEKGKFIPERQRSMEAAEACQKQYMVEIGAMPHEIDIYEPGDPEWKKEWDQFIDPSDYPLYFSLVRKAQKR